MKQSFSPPHHPAINGAAENFVGTFKDKVTKIVNGGKTLDHAVNVFLFDYRSTEHCTTGRSPAWMVYKREIRTRFDLLKPEITTEVETKQLAQALARKGSRKTDFKEGDWVWVDDHRVHNKMKVLAQIVEQLSPVTFKVEVSPELKWKRHVDQMIRSASKPTTSVSQPEEARPKSLNKERRCSPRLAAKKLN